MIFFIIILASHVRFRRYRNHWLGPVWIPGNSGGFSSGGFSGGGFSGGGGFLAGAEAPVAAALAAAGNS